MPWRLKRHFTHPKGVLLKDFHRAFEKIEPFITRKFGIIN